MEHWPLQLCDLHFIQGVEEFREGGQWPIGASDHYSVYVHYNTTILEPVIFVSPNKSASIVLP